MSNDINKAYVSPYDIFLWEFDAKHEKSLSQVKEIKKFQRIAQLRDNPHREKKEGEIWENF